MVVNGTLKRPPIDRRLSVAAAIVLPVVVLAGFARTYYLKAFFHTPPLATLVHIHGVLMTSWVLLFISQVWLISSKRVRSHQRLGLLAINLAILIVIVGFFVAVRAAKFGAATPPPGGVSRLGFLLVPITDLFNFAVLFGAAIYLRKRASDHKRLMLLTAINFLPAALARISVASLQALGPIWFFGFPSALAAMAVTIDWWQNRKLNKWFLSGTLFLLASFVLRLMLMGTNAWMSFAGWLTSWAA